MKALLTATALVLLAEAAQAAALPDDPATRALFQKTCSQCHHFSRATNKRMAPEQWATTVKRMQGHAQDAGLGIDDDTAQQIAAYLSTRYPLGASAGAMEWGDVVGWLSAGLVLGLLVSGHLRFRLRRRFHGIHLALALAVFLVLLGHWTVMLVAWGPPDTAWHVSGAIGGVAFIGVAMLGALRRRIGKSFLRLHTLLAWLGAWLVSLHWALNLD